MKHEYDLAFLCVRGIERVRLLADLTMLGPLLLALNRARAVLLTAQVKLKRSGWQWEGAPVFAGRYLRLGPKKRADWTRLRLPVQFGSLRGRAAAPHPSVAR